VPIESPLPGHLRMPRVKLGGDDGGHLNLPQVCRILGDHRLLLGCTSSVTLFRPSDAAPEVDEQKVGRGGILGQYPAIVGGVEGKTAPHAWRMATRLAAVARGPVIVMAIQLPRQVAFIAASSVSKTRQHRTNNIPLLPSPRSGAVGGKPALRLTRNPSVSIIYQVAGSFSSKPGTDGTPSKLYPT